MPTSSRDTNVVPSQDLISRFDAPVLVFLQSLHYVPHITADAKQCLPNIGGPTSLTVACLTITTSSNNTYRPTDWHLRVDCSERELPTTLHRRCQPRLLRQGNHLEPSFLATLAGKRFGYQPPLPSNRPRRRAFTVKRVLLQHLPTLQKRSFPHSARHQVFRLLN